MASWFGWGENAEETKDDEEEASKEVEEKPIDQIVPNDEDGEVKETDENDAVTKDKATDEIADEPPSQPSQGVDEPEDPEGVVDPAPEAPETFQEPEDPEGVADPAPELERFVSQEPEDPEGVAAEPAPALPAESEEVEEGEVVGHIAAAEETPEEGEIAEEQDSKPED